jgi:8-oxo-dGTP diphosphatase
MPSIRNSAKAIIIRDGKLLCTKNLSQFNEIYYLLPGGGQEAGETLTSALQRECQEEIGIRIDVKGLRFVRDYIADHHEFKHIHAGIHQIEYMFECDLLDEPKIERGHAPDQYQVGVEWVVLEALEKFRLYPKILKKLIGQDGTLSGPVYLGDVN